MFYVTITTLCLKKNVPPLTCYNLYIRSWIATIFIKNVAEKVGNHLTNASALPGETGNP